MDKEQVTNIPHWTTTSTEGGLLLKEENRDKIEEIRNSISKEDSNKVLMENVIKFHVKKKWENISTFTMEGFLKYGFHKIFECEFPVGTSIVGELYTTHEIKDITKQEVEKYINENFSNYNDFWQWVINEMCETEEEPKTKEYPFEYVLSFVEDNLFELLQEYVTTYHDFTTDEEFIFDDYFKEYESLIKGEYTIILQEDYITKWVDDNDGRFKINRDIIEHAIGKHFSSLEVLQLWYNAKNNEKGISKIKSLQHEGERCIEFANEYEKSYDSLIKKESHYNQEVFPEVIKMMETIFGIEETKIFCKLNAFKYRMRAGYKSEDIIKEINKALDYEERFKQYSAQQ